MGDSTRFIRPAVTAVLVIIGAAWMLFILLAPEPGRDPWGAIPEPPTPGDLRQTDPLVADVMRQALRRIREAPGDTARRMDLAMVYHANGQLELAEQCYRQLLSMDDSLAPGWYAAALLASRRGNNDLAIERMQQAIDLDPAYAPAYWLIGQWRLDAGDLDRARQWFTRINQRDPAFDGGWIGLARVHLLQDDPDSAAQLIERRLLHGRNDAYARQLLAAAYRSLGRMEEAAIEAARGKGAQPVLADARSTTIKRFKAGYAAMISRGSALIDSGHLDEAIALLERLLERWPDDPGIENYLALAHIRRGAFDRAIQLLESSIARHPDEQQSHLLLALGYQEQAAVTGGSLDKAFRHVERALQLDPADSQAHEMKAFLHARRGENEHAVDSYRTAVRYDPGNTGLLMNLAKLLEDRGDLQSAADTYQRCVELDPSNLTARVMWSITAMNLGELDQATELLSQATRLAPPNEPSIRQAQAKLLGLRQAAPSNGWKPQRAEFLEIAQRLRESSNPYLGRHQIERLRQQLAQSNLSIRRRVEVRARLTLLLLQDADISGAIEQIEAAIRAADASEQISIPDLYRLRALVYLRQAEISNCVLRHQADCCLLPLDGGGIHTIQAPAQRARDNFERYLELKPDNLAARWLLNVAAMALGEYPQGVSQAHLIPPNVFESEYDVGRFVDLAPGLGVDALNLCGGCIVDDFDNDNTLDIVTTTFDPQGPTAYFRNLGDGRFEDASTRSRIDDQLGGLNCIGGDYNNDGFVDVLILRGAWLFDDGRIRNSLLRNNGDNTFTDVTRDAGLAEPAAPTQTAVWGDFDNDGDLDLFVGNESRADRTLFSEADSVLGNYPSQLFRNNGDGTFTDIATTAGVTNDRYCKGAAAGDFDNDGDLDLYVSNVGRNRLYANDGEGGFTDVAESLGVTAPDDRSFAAWFFDYDNDGWLDLFVTAYDAHMSDIAAGYLNLEHQATSPCLYHNNGDGTFRNVASQMGLDRPYLPMGANFGDLDNDGFLDIYLATGEPDFQALMPNVMLRNDRGMRFQDVTTSGGLGHLQKGHGVAFADFDHDGDQDIYHQLGGFYPGDQFHNALFVNPGHGNHWLAIQLVGVDSNRAGYGARVKVTVGTPHGQREIHRAAGCVSSFGGSPQRLTIGLGDAERIEQVEVVWPASGQQQRFSDVPMDVLIRIVEGADGVTVERLESFTFAAGPSR